MCYHCECLWINHIVRFWGWGGKKKLCMLTLSHYCQFCKLAYWWAIWWQFELITLVASSHLQIVVAKGNILISPSTLYNILWCLVTFIFFKPLQLIWHCCPIIWIFMYSWICVCLGFCCSKEIPTIHKGSYFEHKILKGVIKKNAILQ